MRITRPINAINSCRQNIAEHVTSFRLVTCAAVGLVTQHFRLVYEHRHGGKLKPADRHYADELGGGWTPARRAKSCTQGLGSRAFRHVDAYGDKALIGGTVLRCVARWLPASLLCPISSEDLLRLRTSAALVAR